MREGVTIRVKDRLKPVLDLKLVIGPVIYKGYKA